MPVLSLISRNSPKQLGMVSPELDTSRLTMSKSTFIARSPLKTFTEWGAFDPEHPAVFDDRDLGFHGSPWR